MSEWFELAKGLSRQHAAEILESQERELLASSEWQNPPMSVAEHLELEKMAGRELTISEAHAFRQDVVLPGAFEVWLREKERPS
jgi:hypothetical protein